MKSSQGLLTCYLTRTASRMTHDDTANNTTKSHARCLQDLQVKGTSTTAVRFTPRFTHCRQATHFAPHNLNLQGPCLCSLIKLKSRLETVLTCHVPQQHLQLQQGAHCVSHV
jgi:hypothetical protein